MVSITVVIPTFNAEKVIAAAIDSVISQRHPACEIIVVDDASKDCTVATSRQKLVRDFGGPWQVIELPKNVGPSAARNVGLGVSRGEWLQFLDSDDLLLPGKFATQAPACLAAAEDVAMVYSGWQHGCHDGSRIDWSGPVVQPDVEDKPPVMCLAATCRPLQAASLTRRSVMQRVGGYAERLRFWECEEVNVRLAQAGRLVPVATNQATYLWHVEKDQAYVGLGNARYQLASVALSWVEEVLAVTGGRSLAEAGLSPQDRRLLADDCTMFARMLFRTDRAAFTRFMQAVRQLLPGFVPSFPAYLAFASRYLGYERAEAVVARGRTALAAVRRAATRRDAPDAIQPEPEIPPETHPNSRPASFAESWPEGRAESEKESRAA